MAFQICVIDHIYFVVILMLHPFLEIPYRGLLEYYGNTFPTGIRNTLIFQVLGQDDACSLASSFVSAAMLKYATSRESTTAMKLDCG